MNLQNFIRPELLVLIPVLYFIGIELKSTSHVKDKYIPLLLGVIGIALSTIWMLATTTISTWQDGLSIVFIGVTQGVICAGTSVYANQLIKQAKKDE